jgi:hypothetical protein
MRQKLSFFVFMPNGSWPSSSGLRGYILLLDGYYTILKLADHALSKMVKKDNFCLMTPIVKCKAVFTSGGNLIGNA